MGYPIYFVNAFTEEWYKGNTAAVVIMDEFAEDASLQALAKENGFSETAFVKPNGFGKYALRWFTPETEVDLCGHATLASAKVLFSDVIPMQKKITFSTRSGDLIATRKADTIWLDLPKDDPTFIEAESNILKSLSKVKAECVLYARLTKNLIVVYQDAETVKAIKPDFAKLAANKSDLVFGIIATALGHDDYDYVCRFFAPWEGINEDPVTGSAQVSLAPFWSKRMNKNILKGFQASQRGGEFTVEVKENRVLIGGKALIYLKGEIKRGF